MGSEGGKMSGKNCWCGRDAETKEGDCIFHAPIDKKKPKDFWERFKTYFEETLKEYEEAENKAVILFDCSYFVFPPFGEWRFPKEIPFHITFTNAVFYGDAEFAGLEFTGQVVFVATEFRRCPEFLLIKMYTTMGTLEYPGFADFSESLFSLKANFADSKFFCVADFRKGRFLAEANFRGAEFHEEADFRGNFFGGKAIFSNAKFLGETRFTTAVFKEATLFHRATFKGETYFSEAEFRRRGLFIGIECFNYLFLDRVVNNYARDAKSEFIRDEENNIKIIIPEAEIDLTYCHFYDKSEVYTYKTSVRKWRFTGTTAIKNPGIFGFEETIWKTEGDKRKTVREEDLIGEEEMTYERVGEIYRLIRQNFESRLAFEQASDFHVGQMEMLLADPRFPDSKKFFLRIYKYVSNYGEDVIRPLGWLLTLWYVSFVMLTIVSFANEIAGISDLIKGNFIYPWEYISIKLPIDNLEPIKFLWGKFWSAFKNFITLPPREAPAIDFLINTAQKLTGGALLTFAILALRRAFRR